MLWIKYHSRKGCGYYGDKKSKTVDKTSCNGDNFAGAGGTVDNLSTAPVDK
jgi:hypothetical protein